MELTREKLSEIYEIVLNEAMTDEDFRAELLADPKTAIAKCTGIELPEDFNVKVVEEDEDADMTILLPKMPGEELSDEDMDNVAGGGVFILLPFGKKKKNPVIIDKSSLMC